MLRDTKEFVPLQQSLGIMTVSKNRQASTLNRCLFVLEKQYNRGEVLKQGGRCSYTLTVIYLNEKKNKTRNCSHLHKGGGRKDCQGEGVFPPTQGQTRKGKKPLSTVLRVPLIE